MKRYWLAPGILLAGLLSPLCVGQQGGDQKPSPDVLKQIREKIALLYKRIDSLHKQSVLDPILSDLQVYHRAAATAVRLDEFTDKKTADWVLDALDRGLLRATQAAQGAAPWHFMPGQSVIRAYRSRIDGTVQPFAVTLPADYGKGKEARKQWRIDVVLHGRDNGLTEAKFLWQHRETPAPAGQDFIRLDVYGRGNNAYRWAGETDVAEALDTFIASEKLLKRDLLLDPNRVVLRGFSMGGAGTWHIGLHRPDQWCVIGPGAGFVSTHGYVKDLPNPLPPYQEACLRIYDAVDYAENAFNVPVVAYAGEKDSQLQAARNVKARLDKLNIPMRMRLLVEPNTEHKFTKDMQAKAEAAYAPFVAKGKPEYPPRVHFVTYTLKYPACAWVEILGLDRHYDKAVVNAEATPTGFVVNTANVRAFGLTVDKGSTSERLVRLDGQELKVMPRLMPDETMQIFFQKKGGRWHNVLAQRILVERAQRPQKANGQVGPIDDAFREAFLCVRGTGKPWHAATNKYVEADLQRFTREWAKYFRGELPVKDDVDVTDKDIAAYNLVLFGDPASNSLIAHVLDALPLHWTKEQIALNGKAFSAADHVPALIYPNPLNPAHYLVLNSGHTFHEADFKGTNALLYPRLGDFAVLRLTAPEADPLAVQVATAGLFDEYWQVPKK